MYYFVEVIIPLSLNSTFTYLVSTDEYEFLQVGMRVAVPFGRSKVYTGLVIDKHQRVPESYQAKEIFEILDVEPIVSEKQIELWKWVSEYYMCSLGEVYKGCMPSKLLLESETLIQFNPKCVIQVEELSDNEFLIYEALQSQSILKLKDIIGILNTKKVFPILHSLMQKEVVFLQEEIVDKYKPKIGRFITWAGDLQKDSIRQECISSLKLSAKQTQLIEYLLYLENNGALPVLASELLERSGCSASILKALITKGVVAEVFKAQDRVVFEEATQDKIVLSTYQERALDQIIAYYSKKMVVLLHGVTASGKTEVYIRLIENFLRENPNGQILYLVPDIGLTTQLVTRLVRYFGNQVAVFNSKYSANERLEVYKQVLQGSEKARIIIGTRLAVFLPFKDLQLVVVDEEQEVSYKQQEVAPRYNGRDCAVVLASQHKAKVLLGSATPSLESYYNADQGKYGLVTLDRRYNNILLPEIVLIDLKENYKKRQMVGHFSKYLIQQIQEALALKEQVIIYQNRRGFSPVVECMTCGHVPGCDHCDVSLTYHKYSNELRCHYCGFSIMMPKFCQKCHSLDLNSKGFGTEQVQQELQAMFPEHRIARMDQDTTKLKYSFEKLIDDFKNREIDILVGTQMLARGFDFDNVSLVGILNADNSLFHPDFRAFERAFQTMVQISGRAGRGNKKGQVVIQTYNPNHNIIQQVTNYNYHGMYKEQMYDRYNFKYPPFYRLVRITLKHRDFDKLKQASLWMYNYLTKELGIPVLGPEEPSINRIRNEYLRVILIKIPQDKPLNLTKARIVDILKSFEAIGPYRAVKVVANVDFY
ncbi:replication restart helicase PriA [Myroides sp. LJL115]